MIPSPVRLSITQSEKEVSRSGRCEEFTKWNSQCTNQYTLNITTLFKNITHLTALSKYIAPSTNKISCIKTWLKLSSDKLALGSKLMAVTHTLHRVALQLDTTSLEFYVYWWYWHLILVILMIYPGSLKEDNNHRTYLVH